MDEKVIQRIFGEPPWSDKMLENAARGMAIGSCDDPPEIVFAFWLNLARDQAARHGLSIEEAEKSVVKQARDGVFDK